MTRFTPETPAGTLRELHELVLQLPPHDFLALFELIRDRAETMLMTRLAETGFRAWEHDAEDLYEATAETP